MLNAMAVGLVGLRGRCRPGLTAGDVDSGRAGHSAGMCGSAHHFAPHPARSIPLLHPIPQHTAYSARHCNHQTLHERVRKCNGRQLMRQAMGGADPCGFHMMGFWTNSSGFEGASTREMAFDAVAGRRMQ